MRDLLRGVLYCALWYGSIVAGFLFIACPLLPLLLLSPPRFRKCGDLLFSCWELYPTALLEVFGVKIIVSGDHISPYESAILVMNHRTRVDWNFLWAAMYQACMPNIAAHKLKFILKDPIRHIPGPGWMMQMNGFLYITRRWEEDQGRLSRTLDYLVAIRRRTQLLIFPEGKLPKEVYFHIKRISSMDVPKDDMLLRSWLEKRWSYKEETLKSFTKKKAFSEGNWPMASMLPLRAAFGFWSFLTGATVLLLLISPIFQLWALVHSILFIGLSLLSTGFNQLEMGWYWRWRSYSLRTKLR
ncbi:lysocardiolipin acyltransferase 1 isoform X2 [Cephus cinctus]|uniref:Lysocardiolipin acyltransferase 1 isoform X2 n=1 Tax=Cephus cinctus TaxID=211228 RepID=A0AAJ7R9N2_CEPCN|nr:lysocardiolipin acyltransferase 1 isoform X2 [Cephus cinctus]